MVLSFITGCIVPPQFYHNDVVRYQFHRCKQQKVNKSSSPCDDMIRAMELSREPCVVVCDLFLTRYASGSDGYNGKAASVLFWGWGMAHIRRIHIDIRGDLSMISLHPRMLPINSLSLSHTHTHAFILHSFPADSISDKGYKTQRLSSRKAPCNGQMPA